MTMGFCVSFRPVVDIRLVAAAAIVALAVGPATAQTPVKFSIDFKFEGPSAPFLVALDRGYYKAEGST